MVSLDELLSPDHQYRKFKLLFNFKEIESDLLFVETDNNNKGFGVFCLFKCLSLQFIEDMLDREFESVILLATMLVNGCLIVSLSVILLAIILVNGFVILR